MPVASELLVKINADTGNLESGLRRADTQVSGFARNAGALGSAATAAFVGLGAAAVGLGAGLASSIGQAMGFEQAIANVSSLLGGDMLANTRTLSDAAIKLGQDTKLSGIGASDAADAMRELAAAGFNVAEITGGAARGVLLLASATGTSVPRAAEIAGDAFNAFRKSMNLTAEDMPKIADLFVGAANVSSIGLEDIGQSMKSIGPVAAAMGLDIDEVTAAIAALGNQGIKGEMAGTALRGVLASLADPSKESAKLIKTLGLNFRDSNGRMKDFGGIAEELRGKLGGLTQAQREQAIVQLFGRENLAAILALMSEGQAGIDRYTKAIKEQGDAEAIGAQRNATLRGAIETLKGSLETAQIALGRAFLPALRDLALWAANAVSAVIPLIEAWGPRLVAGITATIGVIRTFGGYVASAIGAVVGAFQQLQSGEITLAQFIGGVKKLMGTVLGDIGTLLGNVAGFLAPFLVKIGEGIRAALPIIGAELLKLGQAFGGWIVGTAIPFLQANLPLWLSALSTWVTGTALPAILGFVGSIGAAFGGWITGTAIPYLQANLPLWLTALQTWVTTTALPAVGTALVAIGTAFGDWVATRAVPWVQENLPGYLAAIGTWVTATAVPAVTGFLVAVGTAFGDWVATKAVPYLQEKLPEWLSAIETWITGTAVPAVQAKAGELSVALTAWITEQAIPKVEQDMPGWLAAITGQIDQANDAAETGTDRIAETMGTFISKKVIPAITGDLGTFLSLFSNLQTNLTVLLAGAAALWAQKLTDWINDPAQAMLKANLANFLNAISEWILRSTFIVFILAWKLGEQIGQGLAEGVQAKWPEIQGWFSGLPGRIQAAVGNLGSVLYQAGLDVVNGLLLGIQSKFGAVQALLGDLTNMLPSWKGPPEKDAMLLFETGQIIMQGLIAGIDDKQLDLQKKLADVTSSIAKAAMDMLDAFRAISGYDFATGTPSSDQLGWLRDTTAALISTISEAASSWEKEAIEKVNQFSDSVSKVGGGIKNALEGLQALARFDFARDTPTGHALAWFVHLASSLVANFADAAQYFEAEALKAASDFAEAAGKVGGSVKQALEGLQALAQADWAEASPSGSAMGWFTHLIDSLIRNFAAASASFAEGVLDAANDFAESAGKVGGSVKHALEGLTALASANWADSSPTGSAMGWFIHLVGSLVQTFATAAQQFAAGALAAASDFAETAGKVVGLIGPAVEGFAKMATLTAPSEAAIAQLAAGIRAIVGKFAEMATMLDAEGTKHAGDFADAAGKALGAAKDGVELFAAMAGDKDNAGNRVAIMPPSAKAIDDLVNAIRYVVGKFREMATEMRNDGIKQMREFASAAGEVLSAAKSGTDLFKSMEKLAVPAKDAIDHLLGSIGYVITQTRAIAAGIGTQGLQEAQAFATGALNVVNTIKQALELFPQLAKLKTLPEDAMWEVFSALEHALQATKSNVNRASDILAQATTFRDIMKEAAQAMADGLAFGNAAQPVASTGNATQASAALTLPALAAGGIVTRPTLALVGERGPEAVVPLSRLGRGDAGGASLTIVVTGNTLLGSDRAMAAELARIVKPEIDRRVVGRV